jgi:hypothetical protein
VTIKRTLFSITILWAALSGVGCSKPLTTEQQIIAVIREMEARIEAGERRPFMNHVAEEFSGQNGKVNRDELRGLVIYQLNRYQRLSAQLFPIRVTETGDGLASARFRALITGGAGWLPENGQIYQFETQWSKAGGDWMVIAATWTPVPLEDVID